MSEIQELFYNAFVTINIGNKELGVPSYNGGLFDPSKHEFLEKYKVHRKMKKF